MKASRTENPETILLDPRLLERSLRRLRRGEPAAGPARAVLAAEAASAMTAGPFSVTGKKNPPPGGDRRDYVSMGPYWWPDPDTPGGRPYVRRDGEHNPESDDSDRPVLNGLCAAVRRLALGWFFLGDDDCARRAWELLRIFFLDPDRGMRPHLRYGQGIPGICEGRGIGIIETTVFATSLVDSILLLSLSPAFPRAGLEGLRGWFGAYLDWLRTSGHGADERGATNNHGTSCDLQLTVFALFAGRGGEARAVLDDVPRRRIAAQVEPDGRQPEELARTRALGYSTMNLRLLFDLASVAGRQDRDLWRFETADGRGIRRALDWLLPFWKGERPWPYPQITPFGTEMPARLLRRASLAWNEPAYAAAGASLAGGGDAFSRAETDLCWPAADPGG